MSIQALRSELKGTSGANSLLMRYEDGGKVSIYVLGDVEVRLPAGLTDALVVQAIKDKLAE